MSLSIDPLVDEIMQYSDSPLNDACDISPIYSNKKLTNKTGDYAALRKWVTDTRTSLLDSTRILANTQIKNLALWTGLHYASQNINADFRSESDDEITVDTHKVIVNNIYDIERNRYSKISRNQPQTKVTPKTPDYDDYVGARIGDAVLKTAKEQVKEKQKINQMLRESFIFGESWIKTWWNKDKGKVDPRWERLVKRLGKSEDEREMLVDGEKLVISKDAPIFIGDHDLTVRLPWTLYIDQKGTPEEVEWVIFEDFYHIEAARAMWPDAKDLKAQEGLAVFNANTLYVQNLKNHIRVYSVFARSSKFMKDGIQFVCTDSCMLEDPTENKNERCEESEWGNLPVERLTDIDVPGRLRGYSTIQILANLQHSENQMLTMMKHYLIMLGHPKMLIPYGAQIEIDELSDSGFYVNYKGEQPPSMLVPNPIPPQVVAFADYLKDKMQKLGDLHGVSSGDLPSNVRAAKAIRLLQELEDLRATSIFSKYNELYLSLDRKILLQTKNYRNTDKRLITLLGKGNEYLIEDFDAEVLSEEHRVVLEISGMLPQQPSARAEFISEMFRLSNGQLFTQEKWVKLLGFESEQEFLDAVTTAVIKAERENDFFIKGKEVTVPQPYENHLVELGEHKTLMQSATFSKMDKKRKDKLIRHVRTHEYLVYLHMQDNPLYRDMVFQTCPWYPLVFKLPRDTTAPGMGNPVMSPPQQPPRPVGRPPQPGNAMGQPKPQAPADAAADQGIQSQAA